MKHKRITVLGSGRIGKTVAKDLDTDESLHVVCVDSSADALVDLAVVGIETGVCDVSSFDQLSTVIDASDCVVSCLPSSMSSNILRACIETRANLVDIGFTKDDLLSYNDDARSENITAVIDCGFAPGLTNILVGAAAQEYESLEVVKIYVGGIPIGGGFKAAFAPEDVLAEYTRSVRVIENEDVAVLNSLSEPELIHVPNLSILEAFNTDGLRTLIHTIKVKQMREKTLRYQGHREQMLILKDCGFFSTESIGGFIPLEITLPVLAKKWKYAPGEQDLTVMRIDICGRKDSRKASTHWNCVDYYDDKTSTFSMARMTAFPATIVARMLANGRIEKKGVLPPEVVIGTNPELVAELLSEMEKRGVLVERKEKS